MNSQEIGVDQDHRKKIVKKQKKGWVKQTKLLQQKVGSALLGFFGHKKPKSPAICSSNGQKSMMGSSESSGKAQSSLSKLFKKGKIQKILETGDSESGQRGNQGTLSRVSSWGVSTRPKLKIARTIRKRESIRVGGESESEPLDQNSGEKEEEEEEEEREGNELCKKRILMGGKCKPLEFSGFLHNGKNGTFSDR